MQAGTCCSAQFCRRLNETPDVRIVAHTGDDLAGIVIVQYLMRGLRTAGYTEVRIVFVVTSL